MDRSKIVWKEAKTQKHHIDQCDTSDDEDNGALQSKSQPESEHEADEHTSIDRDESDDWNEPEENLDESHISTPEQLNFQPTHELIRSHLPKSNHGISPKSFSHQCLKLKLRRNITALSDSLQYETEIQNESSGQQQLSLDQWIDDAIVNISPNADLILFSGQSPDKLIFLAKLRLEPTNQYTTKTLNIAIDFDEQVTSLLCLPIMSTQRTSIGSIDWTALVIGFSSGYVKFYTEQSICLLSLKFCDEPILNLKLQTQKSNGNARSQIHFASLVDELLIVYRSCAIILDGIGLQENLRLAKEAVVRSGFHEYEPAYSLESLPIILTCHKWTFMDDIKESRVLDAELLGTRCTTRFDSLKSDSINVNETISTKSCTRTLALVGCNPFLTCYREAKDKSTHSYTEMITSLLPFWSKPQPSKFQLNEISISSEMLLHDSGRLASSILASPDKRLAVITDDFGRVSLIDVTNWLVIRMWKGYRKAQCGWIEVKRNVEEKGSPCATFLVIHAPKRGLLEVWSAQRGPRVAAFNVGKHCKLLYSGYKMLNMRAESFSKLSQSGLTIGGSLVEQAYSTNCYLLNAKSQTVFLIELPYTYSLYKYGDLESRDHLLIGELNFAIGQDSEAVTLMDILSRVALSESLEICIEKIVLELSPAKIIPIMENLINRIMQKYDNQSGEKMTSDDLSIVQLCKRVIRLCAVFDDVSQHSPSLDFETKTDINQRLIEQYQEHPKEVDEFATRLGWSASEVLRYLSLLTLEQSYRNPASKPVAGCILGQTSLGEPLSWSEFVSCFNLSRVSARQSYRNQEQHKHALDEISIRLKSTESQFLSEDRVIKTSLFLFIRLSENYYKSQSRSSANNSAPPIDPDRPGGYYSYIEPSSRLMLLFQFWLSTKLCNHWRMWGFLQDQIGRISDELRVAVMAHDGDDTLLVESWKRVYQLILESDNIFAAMIATSAIKSDTLRMLNDKEKREKLKSSSKEQIGAEKDEKTTSTTDWECLCIDAERMALLNQQLEDVFLLSLFLNYSNSEKRVLERSFTYLVPRVSVASVLRGGPTVVSELVAQWAAQTPHNDAINLTLFTESYGSDNGVTKDELVREKVAIASSRSSPSNYTLRASSSLPKTPASREPLPRPVSASSGEEDQIKELLHHVKTSFPYSLDRDVILLHCLWEFCHRWTNRTLPSSQKSLLLRRAMDALALLSSPLLQRNAASLAFRTFFQRTLERLSLLIQTNPTILSPKCLRSRDSLARRELNMGEDCLEDFVHFCHNLSEFLLQACRDCSPSTTNAQDGELRAGASAQDDAQQGELQLLSERLLCQDDWWSTPAVVASANGIILPEDDDSSLTTSIRNASAGSISSSLSEFYQADKSVLSTTREMRAASVVGQRFAGGALANYGAALVRATLSIKQLLPIEVLLEMNRLTLLVDLIFKLNIIKSFPLTLIGEESRQILKLDLQQSPSTGADIQIRSGSLPELRETFARRCIVNIVAKSLGEISSMLSEFEDVDSETPAAALARHERQTSSENTSSEHLFTRRRGLERAEGATAAAHSKGTSVVGACITATQSGANPNARHGHIERAPDERGAAAAADEERHQSSSECVVLFANLLSLSREWQLNCDELQLEFVFELFRCNLDKLAKQLIIRVQDKHMLASGLLKICSQRVLVLFGLSPRGLSSTNQWRQRVDKWSLFQPGVASWLKSIQEEELHHQLAELNFSTPGNELKACKEPSEFDSLADEEEAFIAHIERSLGLKMFVLRALQIRTKSVLELVTNYLDGQASRLAYDLLQLLEARLFEEQFLPMERKLWLSERGSR